MKVNLLARTEPVFRRRVQQLFSTCFHLFCVKLWTFSRSSCLVQVIWIRIWFCVSGLVLATDRAVLSLSVTALEELLAAQCCLVKAQYALSPDSLYYTVVPVWLIIHKSNWCYKPPQIHATTQWYICLIGTISNWCYWEYQATSGTAVWLILLV